MTDETRGPDRPDLRALLETATDRVESPHLEHVALRAACRRRVRRRGAVAAAVASVLVAGVVGGTQLRGGSVAPPPSAPSPTEDTGTPAPVRVVQERWDPREVDALPAAADDVAPALPAVIDPPDTSPLLVQDPLDAPVVAAIERGRTVELLATDGSWRSVPVEQTYPQVALSPGGTRLLVSESGAWRVTVHDLATGASRAVAPPRGYGASEVDRWEFVDDDTLLLDDAAGGFLVDAATGRAERVPFPTSFNWRIDPDGAVVESADVGTPAGLVDWATGGRRDVGLERTVERFATDDAVVAGTTWGEDPFSVALVDRRTGVEQVVLPVANPQDYYGKGGLSVLAVTEGGEVLLGASTMGEPGGLSVVAWSPASAELALVAAVEPGGRQGSWGDVALATGLLRAGPASAEPDRPVVAAAPLEPADLQDPWDPDDVADLPFRDVLLPQLLAPTTDAGPGTERKLALAQTDDGLWLLDDGERWQRLDPPTASAYAASTISGDGTRIAVVGDDGIWWRGTGVDAQWRRVDLPPGLTVDGSWVITPAFVDAGRLLVRQSLGGAWVVDLASGRATSLRAGPDDELTTAGGGVLADRFSARTVEQRVDLWRDGAETDLGDPSALESLQRPASDGESVAYVRANTAGHGVGGATDVDGLLALELDGLVVRAFLPVRDRTTFYSDGAALVPLGWLDAGTVLVAVRPRADPGTTWLVTWDVTTGELGRVGSYASTLRLTVAVDALQPR